MDPIPLAEDVLKVLSRLEAARGVWESHWQEIAELLWPDRAEFVGKRTDGDKRTEKVYDATAALALTRFGAAMESLLTPRTGRWHRLVPARPFARPPARVARWLDEVTDTLFRVRYGPRANFASQMHEVYLSIGAFGTGIMFTEDVPGYGVRYRAVPLAEIFVLENAAGAIDYVFRKFELTAKQAGEMFGVEMLSDRMAAMVRDRPDERSTWVHCVRPAPEGYPFPYESVYVEKDSRHLSKRGGYWTFPYAVGRHITAPHESYGRGPSMLVLPEIKMIQAMSKTNLRVAELQVSPPLLAAEEGVLQAFSLRPGAINYGALDPRGQPLVAPLQTGGRLDIGEAAMEERRRVVNDAFLVTLFQILIQQPYVTATEALLRAQEKGQLLAPTMGRQQSELLGPMISREIDILWRGGALPPMPPELEDSGGELAVEYDSPLTRMQKSEGAVGILRTIEAITPLAQIDPTILLSFDPQAVLEELADANGAPARVLRSREEVAALKDQQAEAEQAAALVQALPAAAGAAKDIAQAEQMAMAPPPRV